MPRECAEAFRAIAADLGELKAVAAAARDQATKVNGNIDRLFGRLDDHSARLAVLEVAGSTDARQDREALRTALLAGAKALPTVLSILAVLAALVVWLVKRGAAS